MVDLIPVEMTQFHDIRPFNAAVFADIAENHLLLLDGRETGLADIFRFLACLAAKGGAEGVGSALPVPWDSRKPVSSVALTLASGF